MATGVYDRASDFVRSAFDRRIATPAVLDAATYFPAHGDFCASWEKIRAEGLTVAEGYNRIPRFHEVMAEQAPISDNDGRDWRLFILKAYGIEIPGNMAKCPILAALVRGHRDVLLASITFLGPRKHIPRHRGPFRGVLRFSLGLSVPRSPDGSPAVRMMLDDQEHRMGDGEWLLWDDTYYHEVWNDSEDVRIAHFLDIWRPHMPPDMWIMSKAILAITQVAIVCRGWAGKYRK
jgi:aspartate beta-hydroxylase